MKKIKPVGAGLVPDLHIRNTQKGITLIALIISIIVLLILTIVSMRIFLNHNIIGHAKNAVTQYDLAQEKEKVNLAISQAKIKALGGALTGENLREGLKSQKLTPDRELSKTAPFTFKINKGTGHEYIVMDDGSIGSNKATAEDWICKVTGQTATIIGCNLTGNKLKNVIIPKYLEKDGKELIVTKLGNGSNSIANFSGTIVIPYDVTIDKYAFNGCTELEKVVFGNNITMNQDNYRNTSI